MMKNYNPRIAAELLVRPQCAHGLSRRLNRQLSVGKITSISTERAHINALTVFSKWLISDSGKHLKNATQMDVNRYLEHRVTTVSQKTLDLDRQAINMSCGLENRIGYLVSQRATVCVDRAYAEAEIDYLISRANPKLAFSIELAPSAGLRSMELCSIGPFQLVPASDRPWSPFLFSGREKDVPFGVHGKGGLRRQVRLPDNLAVRLSEFLRPNPIRVSHCEAYLTSYYDLLGGNAFSNQFSCLSRKELGFSHGCHGLRYAFAQKRLLELICLGIEPNGAIKILAQEMGHFAVNNTLTYLHLRFASGEQLLNQSTPPSAIG